MKKLVRLSQADREMLSDLPQHMEEFDGCYDDLGYRLTLALLTGKGLPKLLKNAERQAHKLLSAAREVIID